MIVFEFTYAIYLKIPFFKVVTSPKERKKQVQLKSSYVCQRET